MSYGPISDNRMFMPEHPAKPAWEAVDVIAEGKLMTEGGTVPLQVRLASLWAVLGTQ